MTREDAINFLKGYLDEEVYTEKCRNAHKMAIKALEQKPILDKIRAEIERQEKWLMTSRYNQYNVDIAFDAIMRVVDKCKAESEDKE